MSLEQMIAAAEKRFDEAEEGSTEAIQAQSEAEALKAAKESGYGYTQQDLNSAEKKWKEEYRTLQSRVEGLVGNFDQFENLVKTQVSTSSEASSEAVPGEDLSGAPENLLTRFTSELESRDEAIKSEREARQSFERELRQERLYGDLGKRFKALELQDDYAEAAREFVSPRMEKIVDKAMQGEDVSEDLRSQAERLKELSPVWFERKPKPGELPPPPGVPRSPNGGQRRELTDEERLKRAETII